MTSLGLSGVIITISGVTRGGRAMREESVVVSVKTYMAKPGEVEKKWWLVDAQDKVLGRLAADIAVILMGKHRPTYTPHVDTGDFVVVVNVDKVALTGSKWDQKTYSSYSGYPGLKVETARQIHERHPDRILRNAVRRMLPKNRLGSKMLLKLKLYSGPDHPHQAQQPETADLGSRKHNNQP